MMAFDNTVLPLKLHLPLILFIPDGIKAFNDYFVIFIHCIVTNLQILCLLLVGHVGVYYRVRRKYFQDSYLHVIKMFIHMPLEIKGSCKIGTLLSE